MKSALVSILAFVAMQASAQATSTEFPAEAVPLSATAMQESFSGKTYTVKLVDGIRWKWEFKSNGYFNFSTSNGFSDTGKWSVKETKLCTEGRKINASCNEIRQNGQVLNYKRDNGDIIIMIAE